MESFNCYYIYYNIVHPRMTFYSLLEVVGC